jgi:hypothetical protein
MLIRWRKTQVGGRAGNSAPRLDEVELVDAGWAYCLSLLCLPASCSCLLFPSTDQTSLLFRSLVLHTHPNPQTRFDFALCSLQVFDLYFGLMLGSASHFISTIRKGHITQTISRLTPLKPPVNLKPFAYAITLIYNLTSIEAYNFPLAVSCHTRSRV